MPGATIGNPTPAWLRPENRSVLDPTMLKIARALASLVGMDDPQSQVLNLMTPMVPTGQETLGPIARVGQALAKKIKAFHGSPHDFDQFSLSKIGTGEGAQAYGHGLYFAENEGMAKSYRDQLTQMRVGSANRAVQAAGGDVDAAIATVRGEIDRLKSLPNKGGDAERWGRQIALKEESLAELTALKRGDQMSSGRMYEVEIAADPDTLLDWDEPLSQQSEAVQQALRGESIPKVNSFLGGMRGRSYMDADVAPHFTGADLVEHLRASGMAKESSDVLKSAGIPGIKYLDGGSRGAGEGTRNYVIFDDSLITILRKYGIALPVIEALRQKAARNGGQLPAADVDGVLQQ